MLCLEKSMHWENVQTMKMKKPVSLICEINPIVLIYPLRRQYGISGFPFVFFNLGSWMTTCLGKSCSFGLPCVPFVNCCQFMYLVISLLVLRAGCGIWLYQFLTIAYYFENNLCLPTFQNVDFVTRNDTASNVNPHILWKCLLSQATFYILCRWNGIHCMY